MRHAVGAMVGILAMGSALLAADEGKKEFVAGLDLLANEKWADAAASFRQAVAADDENAIYHLHLGVALTMAGDPAGAKTALLRAGKLEPKNPDVLAWSYARLQMYESTAFGGQPPYRATPYAAKLCDNAIFYGSPQNDEVKQKAWKVIVETARQFAWNQLGQRGSGAMIDRVIELYKANKQRECLDLINKLRAAGPIDWQMLGYSAHCKLSLGDNQGARDEYTTALRSQPIAPSYLIGRAQAELALGSIRDATDDFELSRQIDPALTERYIASAQKQLDNGKTKDPNASAATLWASLKQAVAAGKPESERVAIADQLIRIRGGQRYVRDEEYTRELTRLHIVLKRDPKNADALVDIATFLLDPLVVRKVALPNVDATARLPVGQADPRRAEPLIWDALKIDAGNTRAMEQAGLMYLTDNKPNEMIKWVNKALEAGALTLDLSVMHMDYYTTVARQLADRAAGLRTPTVRFEDRHEGNQIVRYRITTPPTAADLALADQLDQQSRELRAKSIKPLESLAGKLKGSQKAPEQITYYLANAHYYKWLSNYDQSIGAANAVLKVDPYQLDALTFLIDLCPKVGLADQAVQHQNFLNNLANPSSGRTLDRIWPQMKQTRFKGAREELAKAEQIDPGSPYAACAAFAIAQEQNNLSEAIPSGKILLALEHARVASSGRTLEDKAASGLTGGDVIIAAYVHVALAKQYDDDGKFDDVLDHAARAVRLINRVPATARSAVLPDTIKPNDPGKIGGDLAALYGTANRFSAYKLLARGDTQQAVTHVIALANMEPPDRQAMQIGYQIYQSTGFAPFQGKVPDGWRMMFEQWDHQRENNRQFGRPDGQAQGAEIAEIDQELSRIDREIRRGVGPDDLRELESKREELLAKRQRLQQQPRRRGQQ